MQIAMTTPGIHHLALRSTNLARSRRFYADTLGFPVVLEAPGIFLFVAGQTAIAVRGPEAQTPPDDVFSPFRAGLDHIALGCADEGELQRVAAALAAADVDNTGVKLDPTLNRHYVAFKDPDRIAWEFYMAPNGAVEVVEKYLAGLESGNLDAMLFAPDVTFESPLSPRIAGRDAVLDTLRGMLPAVLGVRVRDHVVQGDLVVSRFELNTPAGPIEVLDRFRVTNGMLAEIRPYYDPRPLVAPVAVGS